MVPPTCGVVQSRNLIPQTVGKRRMANGRRNSKFEQKNGITVSFPVYLRELEMGCIIGRWVEGGGRVKSRETSRQYSRHMSNDSLRLKKWRDARYQSILQFTGIPKIRTKISHVNWSVMKGKTK